MAYTGYADTIYYFQVYGGTVLSADTAATVLINASRQVDTLTFNRIVGKGFNNLTEFQQDIIRNSVCRQADFTAKYGEILDNPLASYSINGVSMSFDRSKVYSENGVSMSSEDYGLLQQSGLTFRGCG